MPASLLVRRLRRLSFDLDQCRRTARYQLTSRMRVASIIGRLAMHWLRRTTTVPLHCARCALPPIRHSAAMPDIIMKKQDDHLSSRLSFEGWQKLRAVVNRVHFVGVEIPVAVIPIAALIA